MHHVRVGALIFGVIQHKTGDGSVSWWVYYIGIGFFIALVLTNTLKLG